MKREQRKRIATASEENAEKARAWQKNGMPIVDDCLRSTGIAVTEAWTGTGKTRFAASVAAAEAEEGRATLIVVLVPSVGVKAGWEYWFEQFGFDVAEGPEMFTQSEDFNVLISTYAGYKNENFQSRINERGETIHLIVDEFHHPERDCEWGNAVKYVEERSSTSHWLSGTPWKTKGEIALLKERGYYQIDEEHGMIVKPNVRHTYIEDLASDGNDRGTVAAHFEFFASEVKKKGTDIVVDTFPAPKDEVNIEQLADANDTRPLGRHVQIRTASLSENVMAKCMLARASYLLDNSKEQTRKESMGLVVVSRKAEADAVCWYLENELDQRAEVIYSGNNGELTSQRVERRLKELTDKKTKREAMPDWIVAVGMVSEGVDIPRLKVLVYLSGIMTMLYWIQVIGRVLRRIIIDDKPLDRTLVTTPAHVLCPAHPALIALGLQFEKDKQKALEEREKGGDTIIETPDETERIEWENDGGDSNVAVTSGVTIDVDLKKTLEAACGSGKLPPELRKPLHETVQFHIRNGDVEAAWDALKLPLEKYGIERLTKETAAKTQTASFIFKRQKQDAKMLRTRLRFTLPEYRDLPPNEDKAIYMKISQRVNKCAGINGGGFSKASIDERNRWIECAADWLDEVTDKD